MKLEHSDSGKVESTRHNYKIMSHRRTYGSVGNVTDSTSWVQNLDNLTNWKKSSQVVHLLGGAVMKLNESMHVLTLMVKAELCK